MAASAEEMAQAMLAAAQGPDPALMRDVCDAYLASWREGDPDARAALFAADAVVEDPVGSPAIVGLDAVRAFWRQAEGNGYAFDPRLDLFIACGPEVLMRFEMVMERPGEPALVLTIHEVVVFDAACRIRALRAFFSPAQMRLASAG